MLTTIESRRSAITILRIDPIQMHCPPLESRQNRKFGPSNSSALRVLSHIPASSVAAAHPVARLYSALVARADAVEFQVSVRSDRLSHLVRVAARRDIRVLRGLARRLVIKNLVSQDVAEVRAKWKVYGKIGDHLDRLFGDKRLRTAVPDALYGAFLENLRHRGAEQRRGQLLFRFNSELARRVSDGWFVVFNTLTVDADAYDRVFELGSTAFKDYVRRYARATGDPDNHRYFGVVERGGARGRLHVHVVHMSRRLPRGVADPNAGAKVPSRRELDMVKPLWPHGRSAPIACRFGSRDAYGMLGWRWPQVRVGKSWCPIDVGVPARLASYMGKYLLKSYTQRTHKWRTKMTRNLGLSEIKAAMATMGIRRLIALTELIRTRGLKIQGREIPVPLIRRLAMMEILRRLIRSPGKLSRMMQQLPALRSAITLVEHWQILMRRKPIRSLPSISFTVTQRLMSLAISEFRESLPADSVVPPLVYAGSGRWVA